MLNPSCQEDRRSLLAQPRLGVLPLHIETGRFKNVKDKKQENIEKYL